MKRTLAGLEREKRRIRDRESKRRSRIVPPIFTIIEHSSSSWIILISIVYYILTMLTMPLAWVFNAYDKMIALRT